MLGTQKEGLEANLIATRAPREETPDQGQKEFRLSVMATTAATPTMGAAAAASTAAVGCRTATAAATARSAVARRTIVRSAVPAAARSVEARLTARSAVARCAVTSPAIIRLAPRSTVRRRLRPLSHDRWIDPNRIVSAAIVSGPVLSTRIRRRIRPLPAIVRPAPTAALRSVAWCRR